MKKVRNKIQDLKNISKKSRQAETNTNRNTLHRQKSFVKTWRNAQQAALREQHSSYYQLFNLFADINDDPFIYSKKKIRTDYVLSRDRMFKKGEEEADDKVKEFFNKKWVDDFFKYASDSIFFGSSIVKIGDIINDELTELELVPRIFTNPKRKEILARYTDSNGTSIEDNSLKDWYFIMCDEIEGDSNLGLFNKISPEYVWSKQSRSTLSDYIQKLGVPPVIMKTSSIDEQEKLNSMAMLENFQNSTTALIDINDEIELVETTNNNNHEIYNVANEIYSNNITSLILGSSSLGDEKSFVGSAEISESISNMISLSDMKYIEHYFNNELIPRLVKLGLTFLEGVTLHISREKKQDSEELFLKVVELMKVGAQVNADWIEETFQIPIDKIEKDEPTDSNKQT